MNFELTEEQQAVREAARDFAQNVLKPGVIERDRDQRFPSDEIKQLAELGFMGMMVDPKYGGSGMDTISYVLAMEEISKVDASTSVCMSVNNSLVCWGLEKYGSEEQKQKYLPKLATCEWLGAWGLTEPNTGSDAGNMRTVAKKEGEYYVINGAKNFITHGCSGDVAVVIARTGEVGDSHGMTAFIVERGTPGFQGGRKEDKLGMRASETAEMIFEDCRIHESQVLGKVGEGFIQSMKILDGGRISIAALSLGIAEGALESSITYSKERHQFNKPISSFQGISFKLADMATQVEAARLMTFKAADLKNRGEKVTLAGAQAKYYASEVAVYVANEAVQIFGGYGFTKDYPVEKYYRDAKLCTIGEGTSEIQKLVIARDILS